MNVLVIEDNPQNLYLLRYLLEARGHGVSEARSGAEGIAAARLIVPDLIVLDIQLPQMDGYTVARVLRQIPSIDTTLIVAVTAYAQSGDRARALAAGCDDYIEKPINPDTFVVQLEAVAAVSRRTGKETS